MKIDLKAGDIFLTRNPMWLGRAINTVQAFWASDNKSEYSHAGIILDRKGTTLEALWTVRSQNIYEAYDGTKVLIGRHEQMNPERFERGFKAVSGHQGQRYPFHRLAFHLLPPLAKYISSGRFLVCSEHAGKFFWGAGLIGFYKGRNPDHLADMVRRWKAWEIVYEELIGVPAAPAGQS